MKFFKLVWWWQLSHKIHSVPVKSKQPSSNWHFTLHGITKCAQWKKKSSI